MALGHSALTSDFSLYCLSSTFKTSSCPTSEHLCCTFARGFAGSSLHRTFLPLVVVQPFSACCVCRLPEWSDQYVRLTTVLNLCSRFAILSASVSPEFELSVHRVSNGRTAHFFLLIANYPASPGCAVSKHALLRFRECPVRGGSPSTNLWKPSTMSTRTIEVSEHVSVLFLSPARKP